MMKAASRYGYSDTPTPLPPPPRRIAWGARGAAGLWFMRIFILPHTVVGLAMLGLFLGLVAFHLAGINGVGHITAVQRHDSRKGGTSYSVRFTYDDGGRIASGADTLTTRAYFRLQRNAAVEAGPAGLVGKPVVVRRLTLGPWRQAGLAEYSGTEVPLWFLFLWLAIWWTILPIFLWQAWGLPLRTRWLVKHGCATTGTTTDKQIQSGKSTTYYVEYAFPDPMTGGPIRGKMTTDARGYNEVSIGSVVTVLYDPARPNRSTVYETCAYRVRAEDPPPLFPRRLHQER